MPDTAIKTRPIIFTGEMVRAILDGRKTMTRRVVTVPWAKRTRCVPYEPYYTDSDGKLYCADEYGDWHEASEWLHCPYGKPGERLWVKEAWNVWEQEDRPQSWLMEAERQDPGRGPGPLVYRVDDPDDCDKWRSSRFMPRWASRITLEITDIRVERSQDISIKDIRAEGVTIPSPYLGVAYDGAAIESEYIDKDPWWFWQQLWDSINGKKHPYSGNAWVWVISFKRCEQGDN